VEQARIVQLLVERVDAREDALEVRIRAEGLASLVADLRQHDEKRAA
jgi:site-specific DNA recombinase